jgi:ABC-type branched-subunit amino acid transport system ATPase component
MDRGSVAESSRYKCYFYQTSSVFATQPSPQLKSVTQRLLQIIQPELVEVEIRLVEDEVESGIEESELDEMSSYVGKMRQLAMAMARH